MLHNPFCPARSCFTYSSNQRFSRLVVGSPSNVQAMSPFSSNGGSASSALNSMVSSIVSPSKGPFELRPKQPDRENAATFH
jgi:hypothetical protein